MASSGGTPLFLIASAYYLVLSFIAFGSCIPAFFVGGAYYLLSHIAGNASLIADNTWSQSGLVSTLVV